MAKVSDNLQRFVRNCLHDLKPYIPGKPIEEVKRELGLERVIKLASNENPLGCSEKSKQATRELLDYSHIYPDGNCYELKLAISKQLKVSMDQLIIGNGSDEIIKLLAETFLNQGDQVIAPVPSFSEYWFAAHVMNAFVTGVPLNDDFTYDVDKIIAAVTPKTKMIFICSPNNPTGTYLTKDDMQKLLDNIASDIVVVCDEAYYEYAEADDYSSGIDYISDYRVVVLRTFSKAYGLAAYRVGFAITDPQLINYINRVREPFNVNQFAQVAAAAAIADQDHVEKSIKLNEAGKKFLYNELAKLELSWVDTQANFVFINTGQDSKKVFELLLKRGVIIRSGDVFGYPTYIRVTVGTVEENTFLIEELKTALASLKS